MMFEMIFGTDSDGDLIPNFMDCQPYNPKKHGVYPNKEMLKQLESLPIYFTSSQKPYIENLNYIKSHYHHISKKKIPKGAEKARQRFYSMIKKRPDVVRRIRTSRVNAVVFTPHGAVIDECYGQAYSCSNATKVHLQFPRRGLKMHDIPSEKSLLYETMPKKPKTVGKLLPQVGAFVTLHELKHIDQFRKNPHHKLVEMFSPGLEHDEQIGEKQADRSAFIFHKKFHKKVPQEELEERSEKFFDEYYD